METMKTLHENTIENTCICVDEQENPTECYGDCWDWQVEDFTCMISELWEKNPTYYWRIGGVKLWDREVGGVIECKTPLALLEAMSVNSAWLMRYTVHEECIEYSLSHHDAPMGSASYVRIATEEEIENNRY